MRAPIYLDHHATTPCDPAVVASMLPYFTEKFGNAGSSTHRYGLAAAAAVERARRQVAASIGADPAGLIFTSGATEADNLAVLGVAGARGAGRIVTTAIEHAAVLDAARHAADLGFGLTIVPVGVDGVVDPAAVAAALGPDVVRRRPWSSRVCGYKPCLWICWVGCKRRLWPTTLYWCR